MADLVKITLKVPANLLQEARELDVTIEKTFEQALQDEIDRRAMELVNEEVHAYRREKRAKQA